MHTLRRFAFYYFLRELILKMIMTGLRIEFNNALLTISQTLGVFFYPLEFFLFMLFKNKSPKSNDKHYYKG